MPPPDLLARYEQVFPGCAERIVAMAEGQGGHRQGLERDALNSNISSEKRGQIFGFLVAMTAILCGTVLIALNKDAAGLTAIIAALGALVGTFIYGRYKQDQERARNRREANDVTQNA